MIYKPGDLSSPGPIVEGDNSAKLFLKGNMKLLFKGCRVPLEDKNKNILKLRAK